MKEDEDGKEVWQVSCVFPKQSASNAVFISLSVFVVCSRRIDIPSNLKRFILRCGLRSQETAGTQQKRRWMGSKSGNCFVGGCETLDGSLMERTRETVRTKWWEWELSHSKEFLVRIASKWDARLFNNLFCGETRRGTSKESRRRWPCSVLLLLTPYSTLK